ncbi:MAG: hypothetical protein MI757_05990 [Pirellulales bacterium]|nr:hypothetical protein [Pirellulales bacterium]
MNRSSRRSYITLALSLLILIPSCWGFGSKLYEFFMTFGKDPNGAFAVSPIMNYLFASAGFFFMLLWATANGMFRNIEQPKRTMLETEAMLDRNERPYGFD